MPNENVAPEPEIVVEAHIPASAVTAIIEKYGHDMIGKAPYVFQELKGLVEGAVSRHFVTAEVKV